MKKEKQTESENEVLTNKETLSEGNIATEKKEKTTKVTKIGAMLKEMRQQKGLKLVDISKKLCIRRCYLEAIEESNYSEIPPFPYGNGFIRSYANFLGLNGENIIELYKEETASKGKGMNVLEPQPEASMPNIHHILISLLAIALVYAGWFFYNQTTKTDNTTENTQYLEDANTEDYADIVVVDEFNNTNSTEQDETKPSVESVGNNQIVVSEEVYQEETQTEQKSDALPDVEENKLKEEQPSVEKTEIPSTGVYIEVLKTTWVEVKDKDKLFLSKVLQPGEIYKVPEGYGKILSVGKYDGVNVYINGILTNVVRPQKKMNIYLDKYINPEL